MWDEILGPRGASEFASRVDLLSLFVLGVGALFSLGVFTTVIVFSIKHRPPGQQRAAPTRAVRGFVALWTGVPLMVVLAVFFWSSKIQAGHASAPPESLEILGSARQWLWTFEHENGRKEINALHVPVNVPILLNLESEDVLHRLSLPAFRIQQDTLPGIPTQMWFRPTREGMYRLFCTEFCGTGHSSMSGMVYVLDPITYGHWVTGDSASLTPEEAGEMLYAAFRCDSCHAPSGEGTGPALAGRFGTDSILGDGSAVLFDTAYMRESLLEPNVRLAEGYEPIMPSYKGQLDESQIAQLSAYLESLASD